jgi:hypothetical protein
MQKSADIHPKRQILSVFLDRMGKKNGTEEYKTMCSFVPFVVNFLCGKCLADKDFAVATQVEDTGLWLRDLSAVDVVGVRGGWCLSGHLLDAACRVDLDVLEFLPSFGLAVSIYGSLRDIEDASFLVDGSQHIILAGRRHRCVDMKFR